MYTNSLRFTTFSNFFWVSQTYATMFAVSSNFSRFLCSVPCKQAPKHVHRNRELNLSWCERLFLFCTEYISGNLSENRFLIVNKGIVSKYSDVLIVDLSLLFFAVAIVIGGLVWFVGVVNFVAWSHFLIIFIIIVLWVELWASYSLMFWWFCNSTWYGGTVKEVTTCSWRVVKKKKSPKTNWYGVTGNVWFILSWPCAVVWFVQRYDGT